MQPDKKDISYSDIISLSKLCISKRANIYKNIVIVISVFIVGSIITSLYQWSSIPLIALLFFFPIYSLFLFLDYRQVQIWKEKILQAWENKALDISIVREIVNAVPHFPDATISSMLKTLPDSEIADVLSEKEREKIFNKQQQLHKLQLFFYSGGIIRSIIFFILICFSVYFSSIWTLLSSTSIYIYKVIEIKLLKTQWDKIRNQNSGSDIHTIINNFDQHPLT